MQDSGFTVASAASYASCGVSRVSQPGLAGQQEGFACVVTETAELAQQRAVASHIAYIGSSFYP
jgi:hypothetical protein